MKHANHDAVPQVLILPGWQGSGPAHWQSRWEVLHGYARVEQHDWQQPRRGDWLARLDETVIDSERPVVLVAHALPAGADTHAVLLCPRPRHPPAAGPIHRLRARHRAGERPCVAHE